MRGRIRVKICKYQEALTSWWSVKLDYKLIETAEDGDLVLAFDADGWLRKRQRPKKKQQETRREFKHDQTTKKMQHCCVWTDPKIASLSLFFMSGQRSNIGSITWAIAERWIMHTNSTNTQLCLLSSKTTSQDNNLSNIKTAVETPTTNSYIITFLMVKEEEKKNFPTNKQSWSI